MEAGQIEEFTPNRCERTDVHTKFRWERKKRELVQDTGVDRRKTYIFLVARTINGTLL
jgi:hypothetical protein